MYKEIYNLSATLPFRSRVGGVLMVVVGDDGALLVSSMRVLHLGLL